MPGPYIIVQLSLQVWSVDERKKLLYYLERRRSRTTTNRWSFSFLLNEKRSHWLSEWKGAGNFVEEFFPCSSTVLSHVRLGTPPRLLISSSSRLFVSSSPRLRVQRRGFAAFSHPRTRLSFRRLCRWLGNFLARRRAASTNIPRLKSLIS